MIAGLLKKIFGSRNDRLIRQYSQTVRAINALEPKIQALSDEELRGKTDEFRERVAKGESLDAVLYVAAKDHVQALLAGVDSEVGRIGYVAVTRARNLLWLAVPSNALKELRPALLASGFQEAGIAVAVANKA